MTGQAPPRAFNFFSTNLDDVLAGEARRAVSRTEFLYVTSILAHYSFVEAGASDDLLARLAALCASGHRHSWSDTISLRDEAVFRAAFIRGHRQVTDVYLLGLAATMRGCLATFDRGLPLGAVRRAPKDTLQIITAG